MINLTFKFILFEFLLVVGLFILFTLMLLIVFEGPMLAEKLNFGESSRTFCHDNGGEYSQHKCYLDGYSYEIYYDNTEEQWRLAK